MAMESFDSAIYVVIPLVLLLVTRWLWSVYISTQRDGASTLPLPPGSVGWPIVGETIHFIIEAKFGDFFRRRCKQYGEVWKTHILGGPVVRVTGGENIRQLLIQNSDAVESSWPTAIRTLLGEDSISMSSGDVHTIRRKTALKAFSTDALRDYTYIVRHVVQEELKGWCQQPDINVFHEADRLAIKSAVKVLLGADVELDKINRIASDFKLLLAGFFTIPLAIPGSPYYKALKARERIVGELEETLKKITAGNNNNNTMADASNGVLSRFLGSDLEGDANLNHTEISDMTIDLLFAGHKTIASAITSLVMHLGRNKKCVEKLRLELEKRGISSPEDVCYEDLRDLVYLDHVMREVLRLSPPAGGGYRKARQTINIAGHQIPKGWKMIYSILDTHENSDLYHERTSFCPERWETLKGDRAAERAYLPFGTGSRKCVGREYATLVIKVTAIGLVLNCDWLLHNPHPVMKRFPVHHPADGLPATFSQRQHNASKHDTIEDIYQNQTLIL